jgi:S-adenosylmethionine:tRNA ribosyltransferase-isomerase
MHSEAYDVPEATWQAVAATRDAGGRVVAVGTTVVRALESVAATGRLAGPTDLFIRPGHEFTAVDRLLTNFHLPRTTLLALVAAFVGDRWRDLYAAALADGYRFLSFGDAMLIGRWPNR